MITTCKEAISLKVLGKLSNNHMLIVVSCGCFTIKDAAVNTFNMK